MRPQSPGVPAAGAACGGKAVLVAMGGAARARGARRQAAGGWPAAGVCSFSARRSQIRVTAIGATCGRVAARGGAWHETKASVLVSAGASAYTATNVIHTALQH